MRRGSRVLLAGDYLGTLYTETAIQTGFSAAQEAASLLASEHQQRTAPSLPLAAG
jgi:oxygen-dependent protoporphyrinogen oxidase